MMFGLALAEGAKNVAEITAMASDNKAARIDLTNEG